MSRVRLKSTILMVLNDIFFASDGRLRSGWRCAVFAAGFVACAVLLVFALSLFVGTARLHSSDGTLWNLAVVNVAFLASALFVGWLCNRFLEKLPFAALGATFSKGWLKYLGLGVALGAVTLCLAVSIAAAAGGETFVLDQVDPASLERTLLVSLLIFIVGAAAEESLCRGYLMQTFFHSRLAAFGVLFTSFIFASGHIGNEGSTVFSWLNTFLAGVWFGVAFWRTGSLWFPFGMHLMWNWMQGAIFGIEVSGLTDVTTAPLLKEIDRGPTWLTGETYGIEAGIACTIAILASTALIWFWPRAKPQLQ